MLLFCGLRVDNCISKQKERHAGLISDGWEDAFSAHLGCYLRKESTQLYEKDECTTQILYYN